MSPGRYVEIFSILILIFLSGCRPVDEGTQENIFHHGQPIDTSNGNSEVVASELQLVLEQLAELERRVSVAEEKSVAAQRQRDEARIEKDSMHAQLQQLQRRLVDAEARIAAAQNALCENPEVLDSFGSAKVDRTENIELSVKLFSWNVESDGSDPKVIAHQLAEFDQYDLYALTEVLPAAVDVYSGILGDSFASIVTKTGHNDRMQILYDQRRLELVRRLELHEINYENRYRSPLVAHLRDRETGIEFLVIVNHLARGKADVRERQASQLVQWARDQTLPIIALGDFNFDYVFAEKRGNEAFRKMLRDNIWHWIEPTKLIDTNWFDNPDHPDGEDDYPGSMLDFVFVAGSAKTWDLTCNVLVRPGVFSDDDNASDHRPVELLINP